MKKPEKELEAADAQNRESRLYAEKVRAIRQQILPGIIPAYVAAVSYGLIVWNHLPHRNIVIWLLAQTAAMAGRAYLYRAFKGISGKNALHCWKRQLLLLTYFTGAAWGSAAFFLFPEQVPALQILLILLIGGLSAGTVGLYAVFVEIPTGFITLSLFPFTFRYLLFHQDAADHWMALFIGLYGISMIVTAKRVQEAVTRAFVLAEALKEEVRERRRAESALKAAHDVLDLRVRERTSELSEANATLRKLTNAIEQAAEMIVITDLDGRIEYVNPAAEKTSGYAARKLLGQPFRIFQASEEKSKLLSDIFETLHDGTSWEGEIQNQKKSGTPYIASMTLSAVYDGQGDITHFTAIMRDVTDRKKLEQDLMQTSKLSSLGTLVSGIAHELNTPLATILGFSEEIAKEDALSADSKKYADWIIKESRRCAMIVRNLLKFSRHDKPGKSAFNLNKAVAGVLPLYQYQLQSDFIEVETNIEKLPLPVSGDPGQIQQVVLNILQNAHQAIIRQGGNGGSIRVQTDQYLSEAQISIFNSGPAIPASDLEKIFDPFFTTKDIGDGTGLGLSLSYGIIKEHHGRIRVENMKEGGVRFLISIPLADADQTKADEKGLEPVLPKDLKILIVEDDARFCTWLALFLSRAGTFVIKSSNGLEAIEQLKRHAFNLIISDFKMPEMNGIELCQWLEKHRPEYVQRFVLLTGVTDSNFNDFCQERNIPVLLKPVDQKAFIRTLSAVAERTHASKNLNR